MLFFAKFKRLLLIILSNLLYCWRFKKFGGFSILRHPRAIFNAKNISIGNYVTIEKDATLYSIGAYAGVTHNGQIVIGNKCYINYGFNVTCVEKIIIEDNVLIAYNVSIFDGNHGVNPLCGNYNNQPLSINGPIIIGRGAWIGANSFIMSSIGRGAVIAANSVVTTPIPDYSIAVGSPAKVIKKYDFDKREWMKV